MATESNFRFLKEHASIFLQRAFADDPNTALIKLRQLGEAFAQDIAARSAIGFDCATSQLELLARIDREIRFDRATKARTPATSALQLFSCNRMQAEKRDEQRRR